MQLNVGAFDVDAIGDVGFHRMIEASRSDSLNTVTVFCINRISPSESRKASVDSAPWFPLTRSTCKASRQPPGLEEHTSRPRSFQQAGTVHPKSLALPPANSISSSLVQRPFVVRKHVR